jgi:hypothetical protein
MSAERAGAATGQSKPCPGASGPQVLVQARVAGTGVACVLVGDARRLPLTRRPEAVLDEFRPPFLTYRFSR